jgi:hypothetical protein
MCQFTGASDIPQVAVMSGMSPDGGRGQIPTLLTMVLVGKKA